MYMYIMSKNILTLLKKPNVNNPNVNNPNVNNPIEKKVQNDLLESPKIIFNIFGYYQYFIEKKNINSIFEKDISDSLNLKYIGNEIPKNNQKGRYNNQRFSNFKSDEIYEIFYNDEILNIIYKLTEDFVILSAIESFYLLNSSIHKDFASEIRTIKLLFYLDDLSTIHDGPLYVIPGTHNIYDKYSSLLSNYVNWPPPQKGVGAGFQEELKYIDKYLPKKYLLGNSDNIIFFNNSLLHGSEGNKKDDTILRRSIGMTIIPIDKNNKILMEKIENFYKVYNVNSLNSNAFNYCQKKNLTSWLKHFYKPSSFSNFEPSTDGTDKNAVELHTINNRWEHYLSHLNSIKNDINDDIYNCYENQLKKANKINSSNDFYGI